MQNTSSVRARRLARMAVAAVIVVFGVAAIAKGVDGLSTVHGALELEGVVGSPHMTPKEIAVQAKDAGLGETALPECSIAGRPVDDGATARCFAEYIRIDALMATHGKTYSQLPRFATADGEGTNDPAQARRGRDGLPADNPARNVWVTATALSTALNTSYMAEQIALFGTAVGVAFLLVGAALTVFASDGVRIPSFASTRRHGDDAAV